MSERVHDEHPRLLIWVWALSSLGIAGGTILVASTVDRPIGPLVWPGGAYSLVALTALALICWAVRTARGVDTSRPRIGFAGRVAFVGGYILTAFVAAILLLLIAWLAALAIGAEIAPTLVQALILTIILFLAARITCLCILELALAIRGPTEEADA